MTYRAILLLVILILGVPALFAQFVPSSASGPPQIAVQPQDQSVSSGSNVLFTVSATGATPLAYQWRVNGTNIPNATSTSLLLTSVSLLKVGSYSVVITNAFGSITSAVARLSIDEDLTFRMVALQTNGFVAIEAVDLTGYDRGGMAVSAQNVFLTGNTATGRWRKQDLGGGTGTGRRYDALTSDLRTEKAYTLANGGSPISQPVPITTLIEIDDTGNLLANPINLSSAIELSGNDTGIFAGYGRVVLYDQGEVYNIEIPSGRVTYLGTSYVGGRNYSQNYDIWGFWGVAEYFRGDIYLVYVQDSSNIVRVRVRDGFRETVAAFGAFSESISDMASFTFSPSLSRWFFHYEGNGIFGSRTETLGSAKAIFTRNSAFPDITRDPFSATINAGASATLSVLATGENLGYQWLLNGSEMLGATNATLSISNALPGDAGTYKVAVSTSAGTALSKAAVLTVLTVPVITFGPPNLAVEANSNVTLSVSAVGPPPLYFQWRFKGTARGDARPTEGTPIVGETNATLQLTNVQAAHEGLYSVVITNSWGTTVSPEAALRLITIFPEGASFRIVSLGTSNPKLLDDQTVIGYSRGGMAPSLSRLIYSGSYADEQVDLENLSNLTTRGIYEALASDLRSGSAYVFARTNTPISYNGLATHLLELDGTSGQTNGRRVALSSPIPMPGTYNQNVGFFSGYGRILVYNETNMYSISLPSGSVTNLGPMAAQPHSYLPTWSYWGIAEYYGGVNYIVYPRNNRTISRTRVPDGVTTTLATFANLGQTVTFTVSLYYNRWYFHYEGASQFGGTNETLGFADATFEISPVHHYEWAPIPSPQVVNSPFNVRLMARTIDNSTVTNFSGTASLSGVAVTGGASVPILPATATFVNGIWDGQVTVTQPVAAMYLRAIDTGGFSGNSPSFSVLPLNDLFVTITDAPDPVVIGQGLSYTIVVSNTGPTIATGATLTNFLPPSATFQSVNSSVGSCTNENGIIRCDLGDILGGTAAVIGIQVTSTTVGSITNRVAIGRSAIDADLTNNTATAVTTVTLPALAVSDASLLEDNSGTNLMTFTVTLSAPATNTVTVNFGTFNGTASGSSDYVPKSGTLTFAPGVTNQTVQIGVRGDTLYETNETFSLGLNSAVNAAIARNTGIGTILNDDPAPTVFLSDATIVEGNTGTTNMAFQVRLSAPTGLQILIGYSTSNGTAMAGSDYVPLNAVLSFGAGTLSLTQNIQVPIVGDTIAESNEFFYVNFNFVSNAPAARVQAIGNIINEDGIGVLDHFVFSPIASPQGISNSFPITLTAKDFFATTITSFNGTVGLNAEIGIPPPTNSVLNDLQSDASGSGSYTLGYSFTPSHDITMTHFRHFFGTKVSLWTDDGILLATRNMTNSEAVWTDIPLDQPLILSGGAHYRIATFTGGGNYYYPGSQTSFFADGTIDRSYYALNDAFPTNRTTPWWLVDLRYSAGTVVPISISPTNSGTFSNGIWSGSVSLLTGGTNVTLQARDAANNHGISAPFDVVAADQADVLTLLLAGMQPVPFGTNFNYTLQVSNAGPAAAFSAVLTHTIPPQLDFISATALDGGSCSYSNGILVCNLPDLAAHSGTAIAVVTRPLQSGFFALNSVISTSQADPNLANNVASLTVTICSDCDNDGILDDWELAHGLDPSNRADGDLDNDGDGHTNLQEFLAGTDPNSSNSVMRISYVHASKDDIRIRFNGITGKRYRLERSDGMPGTFGSDSNWIGILTFRVGTSQIVDLIDSSAMRRTNSFYRVRLLPPPAKPPGS